ncbi:MAG TPA: FAD-dependent oxidoreductase [Gaiellaceae bacterium]
MARVVVAGAGAIGASVAYHLALLGARDVVLADRGRVAGGATAKAMGGVRQQFSTAAEVRLAQASIRFFEELGSPLFDQVGYLFLATTEEGAEALEERRELQEQLGVPVERVDPSYVEGLRTDDVLDAVVCSTDGTADPPAVTRELVRRATKLGVEVREGSDAASLEADALVIACGPWSAELGAARGVELPVRPLCRQLLATGELDLPERLPMVLEAETGFHFRRRGSRLVLAITDPEPRWGFDEVVDESLFDDRLARLHHRYPAAAEAGATIEDAWAGLYDMTPDAHPILGEVADGVYAACGFSGHGFMQSPAVGRAVAEEILGETPSLDLSPYRLNRFDEDLSFPETLVL